MAEEQKPDPSLLRRVVQRECKVASARNASTNLLSRTPSFSDWTDKGLISRTSRQSPIEFSRPPTSSPRPQNQGQGLVKNEPWSPSKEQSYPRNLTSAVHDWIGPGKFSINKVQSHYPSNVQKAKVPFPSGNQKLHSNTPSKFPSANMAQSGSQLGNRCPNTMENRNQVKLLLGPSIPTRPRSGLKRKTCGSEPQSPSQSTSNMSKKSVDLICEICQVSCSSALTMQQHLNGRPHKAKLMYKQLKRNCTGNRTGKPRCEVCEIWCQDRDALALHFKGQKHKAKLQELEISKRNGGEKIPKTPILCELCRVPCMNEDLYKMHLKGRQHATKKELRRRGML